MADVRRPILFNFRVSAEEKTSIEENAKLSAVSPSEYVRQRVFGLKATTEAPAAVFDPAEGGWPLPPRPYDDPEIQREVHQDLGRAAFDQLVTQLKGQGMTTPVARREARKRLGL